MALQSSQLLPGTLAAFLADQGGVPFPQSLEWIRRLAEQVAGWHESGRLHRAIVPDAVCLGGDARPLLTEPVAEPVRPGDHCELAALFPELARVMALELPAEVAAARARLVESGIMLDPRQIDLFQLGALWCRMMTGESVAAYLRSPQVKGKVPVDLRPLLERALGRGGPECFRDAREFVAALETVSARPALSLDNSGEGNDPEGKPALDAPAGAPSIADTSASFASSPGKPDDTSADPARPSAAPSQPAGSRSREAPLPFTRLAHYEIVARLGRGGMGEVYRGYERTLERQVAIKVLPADRAGNPDFVRRFKAEATAAANLIHPNIIRIYFIGEDAGHHFFAMQYVEGESLADLLQRCGKLAIDDTLAIVEPTVAGLAAAHRQGMVHRDIKPANILLDTANGGVILADFGLVKSLGSSVTGHTASGVVMGTVDYISPEQGRGLTVDGRSDLYSIGVLLYQMLSGRLPFVADNPTALVFQHVYEAPPPLAQTAPHVPAPLAAVVERLLAKAPGDRHQSAQELLDDLRAFRSGQALVEGPIPKDARRTTSIVRLPASDDDGPPLPAESARLAPLNWWQRVRAGAASRFRRHAPEVLLKMQDTQQRVEGVVAEWERRGRQLQELAAEAASVLASLEKEARDQRTAAQAAARHIAAASNPDSQAEALRDRAECERSATELDAHIIEQQRQLESIQLRQAQVQARVHECRNQRDIFNARLQAAGMGGAASARSPADRRQPGNRALIGAAAVAAGVAIAVIILRSPDERPSSRRQEDAAGREARDGRAGDESDIVNAKGPESPTSPREAPPSNGPASVEAVAAAEPQFRFTKGVISGQRDRITTLAFKPNHDGRIGFGLAAGDLGGAVQFFRIMPTFMDDLFRFRQPQAIHQIAFSPDGARLASASADRRIIIYDVLAGRQMRVLNGHTQGVTALQFSWDGSKLMSGSTDGTVRVWDIEEERELKMVRLGPYTSAVRTLSWSRDGAEFLVGGDNYGAASLSLYRLDPEVELRRFATTLNPTIAVRVFDGGKRAVSAGMEHLHVWDTTKDTELSRFGAGFQVCSFTDDGRLALTGNADQTVTVWDTETGTALETYKGHAAGISSVTISADGRFGASAADDGTIRLWEMPPAPGLVHVFEVHQAGVTAVAFSPGGREAVSCGADGMAQILQVDTLRSGSALNLAEQISALAFAPYGERLLYATAKPGSKANQIGLRLMYHSPEPTAGDARVFRGFEDRITSAVFSSDGRLVAGGSDDGSVRVWEILSERDVAQLAAGLPVHCLAFVPNQPWILWGGEGNDLHLWNYETGDELRRFEGHASHILGVQVTRDGQTAISAGADGTVRVWDVDSGGMTQSLAGHVGPVLAVAISPDGKFILSGGDDGTVRQWDFETGRQRFCFRGHTGAVRCVGVSPNCQQGLSGGDDWTVRLWNLTLGSNQKNSE